LCSIAARFHFKLYAEAKSILRGNVRPSMYVNDVCTIGHNLRVIRLALIFRSIEKPGIPVFIIVDYASVCGRLQPIAVRILHVYARLATLYCGIYAALANMLATVPESSAGILHDVNESPTNRAIPTSGNVRLAVAVGIIAIGADSRDKFYKPLRVNAVQRIRMGRILYVQRGPRCFYGRRLIPSG